MNTISKYDLKKKTTVAVQLPGTECLIKPKVPLSNLTSLRVGGLAQWYVAPKNWQELEASLEWYQSQDLPLTVLGAGSNLLVSDRGIPGLTIGTRHLRYKKIDFERGTITVGAGEPLARLAWLAAKQGWRGLEWAVGIPGTVGGAVVMNAGAHGQCIADCLVETSVVSPQKMELESLDVTSLDYQYRSSILQNDPRLVVEATFQLEPGFSPTELTAIVAKNLQDRTSKQPYDRPSCGSVFRNPKPYAAGWLIEQIGLKGYQIGGAIVSQRHANFILNCGNATADDILKIIHHIQEKVEDRWLVKLHPEVKLVGEF
ncbi:MAG: UDP-N-acetylmuramate dehydrogenase [Prochloraceae cyanobacterium]|nr:UDP-N-acetylmuramate dehydrogenase [Prochloraceae cyanobacterium]